MVQFYSSLPWFGWLGLAMTLLSVVSLIRLFNFYLAAVFIIGVIVRIRQYRIVLGLSAPFGSRWPRLLALIKKHSTVLLSWGTMLPGVLTLTLMAVHTVASQFIWPSARLTLGQLALFWPGLIASAVRPGHDGAGRLLAVQER